MSTAGYWWCLSCDANPTFSPMKSIGALSRSPSPITMVPSMPTVSISVAHRFDGNLIGLVAVAESHGSGRRNGRALDDAQIFKT